MLKRREFSKSAEKKVEKIVTEENHHERRLKELIKLKRETLKKDLVRK